MNGKADFYQSHLDRVSRSFAFCIRQLPEPLRDWVGLSYLLCRVVDTIEDSRWTNWPAQLNTFHEFDRALMFADQVAPLNHWRFPDSISENEKRLVADAALLMRDFHELPAPVVEVIRELVLSMSQGMQHFCQRRQGGDLRLTTLGEVNQYCFFVAGVVGELLAKLVSKVEPKFRLSQLNVLRAHHFGLFLQKVNLLKDQVGDEQSGRHLIPSRQLVEESSRENALQALDFLLDLPKEQIEFRRFCAWSLFLGLEALRVARDSLLRQRILKVSRSEMQTLFDRVEKALPDDGALRGLFESVTAKLGWSSKTGDVSHRENDFPEWLLKLYKGPLDPHSLMQLGVSS